jgi:hypothetical protein
VSHLATHGTKHSADIPRALATAQRTVTTVECLKALAMVRRMIASVATSKFAVASSTHRMGARFRRTRHRHRSCRCPTEKLAPFSCTCHMQQASKTSWISLQGLRCGYRRRQQYHLGVETVSQGLEVIPQDRIQLTRLPLSPSSHQRA